MRYLISSILLMLVVFLTALVAYCIYAGLTDHWSYFLVGIGIFIVDAVAIATLSAAIPASREY
jgi:hypothetical protein